MNFTLFALLLWLAFVLGFLLGWVTTNWLRERNTQMDNDDLRRFRGRVKTPGQTTDINRN